jgi:putative two-component system response regulator
MANDTIKVLVADDEPAVRSFLGALLEERGDCELHLAADGDEAFRKLAAHQPDLLITDLRMPRMSGEHLAARALELQPDLTIIVETGNPTLDGAVRLMRSGVFDFITKPFLFDDLQASLDRAMDRSRKRRSERSLDAIVESLMAALERKDPYLRGHSYRVSRLCESLGRDLGLGPLEIRRLSWAGLVHDVGKIGIPEAILHKPGALTETEFCTMKKHPIYSVEIVHPLSRLKGGETGEAGIYHHHERMDGMGYPDGLVGEAIPLDARIIAVCDAYDAMATHRPYRGAMSDASIRSCLQRSAGEQLDGDLVEVFLNNLHEYQANVLDCERSAD